MRTRTLTRSASLVLVALLLLPYSLSLKANAQTVGTSLTLEPHCTEADRSTCKSFTVMNADKLQTELMKAGDIVDIDIVLRSNEGANIRDVHAWLAYDKSVLEGRSIELGTAISSPTPGESTFDVSKGLAKIGGGVSSIGSAPVSVARVTFRVLKTGVNTELSFHEYLPSGAGHTAVNGKGVSKPGENTYQSSIPAAPCIDVLIGCGETAQTPLLTVRPATLVITLNDGSASSQSLSSSRAGTSASSKSTGVASNTTGGQGTMSSSVSSRMEGGSRFDVIPSAFTLLQMQGLQVTTRDTTAYLGWQELKSTELRGINVYYGTVSGRYIQRRSVPPTAISMVLRDLEAGTVYYFAIRGFNERNEETMFSQEVSVVIGQPETATSPLLISGVSSGIPSNSVTNNGGSIITGETGVGSIFTALFIASALIGTAFAFRRQLHFFSSPHVA